MISYLLQTLFAIKLLMLRNTNSHFLHGKLFHCIQKDIYAPIVHYYFLLIFIFYLARKVEIIWQLTQFLVTLQLKHHKEIINLSHKALAKRKSSRNTWLVNRDKLKPTAESHARSHLSLNKCRVPAMSAKMDKRSISMTISPNMMHLLSSRTGCLMDNNRK